jgi:PmbA protein
MGQERQAPPADYRDLAAGVVAEAGRKGADAADVIVIEGTDFVVTVRRSEVETLKEAKSRALGLRVFVGRRCAMSYTSDFSPAALAGLVADTVGMARVTGEDPAAGLPDEVVAAESIDLDTFDPSPDELPTADRIELARRAEATALAFPEITNSQGATYASGDDAVVLANSRGFVGRYRASSVSLSVTPVSRRDGQMERDGWYTQGRGLRDLSSPEEVGRVAAERTVRRLGARKVPTAEVPVVFDPETAAEILGHVFGALSGYAVFRNATFLNNRLGEVVASPLLTLVDDGRRRRGLGSRPFDGEGLPTRRNVPLERGLLRQYLCDSYAARKIGARPDGCARRAVGGAPSVGASNLYFEAGTTPPEVIVGEVERGLLVTDLIGSGVNLVSGDYSQGAVGHWIEKGRLVHPVSEVTIAGNLRQMLLDVDAVGNDLVFRSSVVSPTLRVRRMTVAGD